MGSPGQLPKRPVRRRFADDAERDAVILSAQDIRVAQEAIRLDRADHAAGGEPVAREPADRDQPRRAPDQEPPAPGQARAAPPDQRTRPPGRTAAPPSTSASTPPSWGTVLATTIRLWWRRHGRPGPAGPRWRVIAVVLLVAVVLAWAALSLALAHGNRRAGSSAPNGGNGSGIRRQAGGTAALKSAAAARTAAAAWLAQQVAPDAIVACDPQMCAVLQQAGLPAGRLLVLGTGTSGPLSSDVLVATVAVRAEFGARLASVYAPDVLASFGTGSAQVTIRVVAADGAARYAASLRADRAARVAAGKQLLRNPRIHPSAAARAALAGGHVDARLLTVFAGLATLHSVRVLGFTAAPAGASPGLPLRTAVIAPAGPGAREQPNGLPSLASFLRAQLPPYRPASITEVRLAGGSRALRVEFAAPSPLGLLGTS